MLEDGMPGRVGILELLHGEDEVGDDEHEHGDVEGIRVPRTPQPPLQPQESHLPRQRNLPAMSERCAASASASARLCSGTLFSPSTHGYFCLRRMK